MGAVCDGVLESSANFFSGLLTNVLPRELWAADELGRSCNWYEES